MNKYDVEEYAGTRVKLTMMDNCEFEGLVWFLRFTDETETEVLSLSLDSSGWEFYVEDIIKIESLDDTDKMSN